MLFISQSICPAPSFRALLFAFFLLSVIGVNQAEAMEPQPVQRPGESRSEQLSENCSEQRSENLRESWIDNCSESRSEQQSENYKESRSDNRSESRSAIQSNNRFSSISSQIMDTTLYLDEILIESTRIYEPPRYQPVDVQVIDSLSLALYRNMPVSAVLSRYSSLFIRDNGPGGLATLSQRGLSPSQTQVLWNGFPVNSLSLGLADLSLLPSGLFNAVEVSPGTPSSAFGGGSLGGTVYLSSLPANRKNHVELTQSAGAFGAFNSRILAGGASNNWSASVRGMYATAHNDFTYFNRATGQKESRINNAGRSGQVIGSLGYRLSAGRIFSSLWLSDSREEIPGSILSGGPAADQQNQGFRWLSGVEMMAGGWNVKLQSFLERDRFHYIDSGSQIDSRFHRGRWLTRLDFHRPALGPVIWHGGISGGLEMVETGNYTAKHRRNLLGLRLNPEIRLSDNRLRITPTVRVDAYTDFGWVLSPSLGLNREVFAERLYVKAMVSRDFNPPSFNDLYWIPGGNPGLDPERSFRTEGGFAFLPAGAFVESINLTGYRIRLEDGIYWTPDRTGRWTPANIENMNAYGAESRLIMQRQAGPADMHWTLAADWRRSEVAAERFPGDQAVGRQMRYIPEWTLRSDLGMRIKTVMLNINYRWTDRRYITEDHSSSLDSYQVIDLLGVYERRFRAAQWQIQVSARNILNEQYEIIQWYPMPGRHLEVSLSVGLPA